MKPKQLLLVATAITAAGVVAWWGVRRVSAAPETPVLPEAPEEVPRAGTATSAPSPSASSSKEATVLVINSNTQATLGDLRIAAFNFRDETYKDESGADKQGRTCALHVFVKDDEAKDQKLRVHSGQKFVVTGKSFEVLEVAGLSVRISVK